MSDGTKIPFVDSQVFVIRLVFHPLSQVFRALYNVLLFIPFWTAHDKLITFRVYDYTLVLFVYNILLIAYPYVGLSALLKDKKINIQNFFSRFRYGYSPFFPVALVPVALAGGREGLFLYACNHKSATHYARGTLLFYKLKYLQNFNCS
jgi:hypothetical protein